MYGPMPDSTYIEVSGGWHDAGDQLRYLLTSGNTICRLLFSYRENKKIFKDRYNYLGQPFSNTVPDILDEAKWGLDWMFKMHPAPDQLFHQVADDRDHTGWELPYEEKSDYGWGPGSYRVVYYATGEPQGLGEFKNSSTGIANLAGRFAAAMAMAAEIWAKDLNDAAYSARCLKVAKEVYDMGLAQPGCQEGTPHNAPYRYYEITWADDMEWGAAELFRVTKETRYLEDAKKFARLINKTSWMGRDSTRHYEYYPFMNLGHYALFPFVNSAFRDSLSQYYRDGLEKILSRAQKNPYNIGIPFIWCSNNLAAAFVKQCLLYQKMTGDLRFKSVALAHRDWLLGRNPWGVSQFVAIPEFGGVTPQFPHSVIPAITGRVMTGGLNDGPVYASIYNSLKGIRLINEDKYSKFQSDYVVYHDDLGDYSTNEPTLDGSAEAIYCMSFFANSPGSQFPPDNNFLYDNGGIVRGDNRQKRLALTFTGGDFNDGGNYIKDVLRKQAVQASFFFTGDFYRDPDNFQLIVDLHNNGHYLGPHSDKHLLYCSWEDRDSLLVTKSDFTKDLLANYKVMESFNIHQKDAVFYIPPYEWYNDKISDWSRELGLVLCNFTPGTASNADYTTLVLKNYQSSDRIFNSIINFERKDPYGLNGFLLLLHIGTDPARKDKFYYRLNELIEQLKSFNYEFVRVDELLAKD